MTPDVPTLLQAILDAGDAIRHALAAGDADAAARLAEERGALVVRLGAPHEVRFPPALHPLAARVAAQHALLADATRSAQERLLAEREQASRLQHAAGRYAAAPAAARLDAAG
jgi:hypothetical protein